MRHTFFPYRGVCRQLKGGNHADKLCCAEGACLLLIHHDVVILHRVRRLVELLLRYIGAGNLLLGNDVEVLFFWGGCNYGDDGMAGCDDMRGHDADSIYASKKVIRYSAESDKSPVCNKMA